MVNLDNYSEESARKPAWLSGRYDQLCVRLELLEGPERDLLEAYYLHHLPIRSLAGLTGHTEKTVSSRIRALTRRLLDGAFIEVVRRPDVFGDLDRQVAYDHFILKMGYRRIALKRRRGAYQVRRCLESIRDRLAQVREAPGSGAGRSREVLA